MKKHNTSGFRVPLKRILHALPLLASAALPAAAFAADTLKLDNGDELTGRIEQIHKGVVLFDTVYAGKISINQTNITAMTAGEPVNVRAFNASLPEEKSEGEIDVGKTETLWRPGAADPGAPAVLNPWSLSVAAETRYMNGNSEDTVAGINVEVNYILPSDFSVKLNGATRYNKTDGTVSEHNISGSADFELFVSDFAGVYVREDVLTDRANDIRLRSTTALGGEYFVFKNEVRGGLEMLRLRAGFGYRYEKHRSGLDDAASDMTLDFGARFHKRLSDVFAWTTELTCTPAVQDFDDYRFSHESKCEVDLASRWRITQEFGLINDYNSHPADGKKSHDTTIYARVKKTW